MDSRALRRTGLFGELGASLTSWVMSWLGRYTGRTDRTRDGRNIRLNVLHGMASILAANMVQPFVGILAVKYNASNFQVGLLSSAPAVISLAAMIPGARYVDSFPRKKRVTTLFMLGHRLFYLLMAFIPFFTPDRRAALLVGAIAIMNLPGAISNVAWQAFVGGIIPPEMRASAFAARNRLMNIVGTATVLVVGRVLDWIGFPLGYQIIFAAAFVMALLEIWVFNHLAEPEPGPSTAGRTATAGTVGQDGTATVPAWQRFREAVAGVLAHPRFVRYTLASMAFYFMWQIPWPLFTLYQVRVLGANNTWVSLLNLANTGGSIVGYGFWANFADRHGHLRTLFVASLGIFLVPLAYAFSHSLTMVAGVNLMTGAIFSGVNLSLFNYLLEVTPEQRRTTYIAYYNTTVNIAAIAAPLVGVAFLNWLGFQWAFILCATLRFAGSFFFDIVHRIERAQARRIAGDRRQPPSPPISA